MLLLALCYLFTFPGIRALRVASIDECPALTPRIDRPTNVNDVRPDDIKAIAGLGDSYMTAARMYRANTRLLPPPLMQYEGSSFAMGGDEGATTLPKFFEKYSPDIKGASLGERLSSHCEDSGCGIVPGILPYVPSLDNLNAAINGAISANLNTELDYLISRLRETPGLDFTNDWKLITVNIGGNDQCALCGGDRAEDSTPERYGANLQAIIERIHQNVPRVIVNIMGVMRVSLIYELTKDQPYCHPITIDITKLLLPNICSCFVGGDANRTVMDNAVTGYNQKIMEIYEFYKANPDPNFGVVYTPANLDILNYPLEVVLSNVDCIHPTLVGHQWLAKVIKKSLHLAY
ncbi:hypothetical protein BX666DRAFT_1898673 [Dichotomocladium elegans]|nr:hypothetical protein BX666DRAFT_1898673 [Dichotomocladium elegans]